MGHAWVTENGGYGMGHAWVTEDELCREVYWHSGK